MDTLEAGITAAREGHREEARELLRQALQADPRSEQGWLWMSAAVETGEERRICLERVLTINPKNQTAQAGLEKLGSADGLGDSFESYLPVSQSTQAQAEEPRQAAAGPVTEPPSPHTTTMIGTGRLAISIRFLAMASACPRSSASIPGYAPGVSTNVMTGLENRAARCMIRRALR